MDLPQGNSDYTSHNLGSWPKWRGQNRVSHFGTRLAPFLPPDKLRVPVDTAAPFPLGSLLRPEWGTYCTASHKPLFHCVDLMRERQPANLLDDRQNENRSYPPILQPLPSLSRPYCPKAMIQPLLIIVLLAILRLNGPGASCYLILPDTESYATLLRNN